MNRRNFIKSLGAASLAIATPSVVTKAATITSSLNNVVTKTGGKGITLRFAPYELTLRHSFNLAKFSRTVTPDVQIEVEYDGVIGYGESSMPPYLGESVDSVMAFLNRVDLSQFSNPFRLDEILEYIDGIAPDNTAAKAGVDIALHDLIGKLMNKPWHAIWGFSKEQCPATSFTIGIDEEQVVRQKVNEAEPYSVLKVKMGLDRDKETIEVIRSMTNRPICVDVNQGWSSKEQALEMCQWLSERNCLFVEQPLPKEMRDETAWLRERSPLPIIADEAIKRLTDVKACEGVYDGINIKLMKSTGMREAHKMALFAKMLGMKVMLGCMTETSCAVSAAAQLAPIADWADLDGNLLITNDRFSGMTIVDGRVTLNELPGIGVTLLT
jgi:L-alanine-DL-glutamate epimerase-like enolase superfamily enzyme